MKPYKKHTIKQLRDLMTKRGIGYMSGWTKGVLIKRLEEEDKKGIYTPDSQLEQFKVMIKSLEIEKAEVQKYIDECSVKQQRALELNNKYAKEKANCMERITEIDAHVKFIKMQTRSITDDLDPNW